MKSLVFLSTMSAAIVLAVATVFAADPTPAAQDNAGKKTIKSTYLITGLHCPPCTSTVEKSLKSMKGVQSIKVDWATKNARIEFDEQQVTAQQISERIGSTAHMMGGKMHYAGWLALKVPDIGAEGNAEKAKSALTKIKGVSTVTTYPKEKSIGIAFTGKGNITTTQLVDALKEAGLDASVIP
jgi:copper chaperone CopZ